MGEGACVLVLESLDAVLERGDGSMILAEVLGYGCNGDAYHPTAPDPEGSGAERAMAQALKSAGRTVDEVRKCEERRDANNAAMNICSHPAHSYPRFTSLHFASLVAFTGGLRQLPRYVYSDGGRDRGQGD